MTAPTISEHLDVLIVGAGLSGIGAGSQLEMKCPGKTYAVLEARNDIGGTWDLFRYPGIRSDSDMFTLGYAFRPWTEPKAIADGPSILRYVRDTAREHRVDEKVRFGHRVVRAEWSSADARWTRRDRARGGARDHLPDLRVPVHVQRLLPLRRALHPASSPGTERFRGTIVHPQHWTDDIDYAGKRVVVIGSGATAVTLVPAMAETRRARHDAPALAQLRGLAAGRGPVRQPRPAPASDEARVLRGAVEERAHHHGLLQSQPPAAERDQGHAAQGGGSDSCRTGTTWTPTSSPATTRGTSACASSRTATSSRR